MTLPGRHASIQKHFISSKACDGRKATSVQLRSGRSIAISGLTLFTSFFSEGVLKFSRHFQTRIDESEGRELAHMTLNCPSKFNAECLEVDGGHGIFHRYGKTYFDE